jgi:transcriptional regulator
MYVPSHFREERLDVIHDLMRRHSLATLVTMNSGRLTANHIPMLVDGDRGAYGTVRGHVARANPVWRDVDANIEALAIFSGPDAYISPSWYEEKDLTGKVVPTWNYAVVHAYGRLEIFDEPVRIREIVRELTDVNEASFEHPWAIEDAPPGYIDTLINSIVGIELHIESLKAKWKMSQNRSAGDRRNVIAALDNTGTENARRVAREIRPHD